MLSSFLDLNRISFESQHYLWLLILALLIILISFNKSILPYSRRILRLQSILFALLIVMLANPLIESSKQVSQAVILVDLSDSVDQAEARTLYQKAQALLSDGEQTPVIVFAGTSKSAASNSSYESLLNLKSEIQTNSSDLEKAIRSASNLSQNIILISDAYQNRGNLFDALPDIESRIFPLIPKVSKEHEGKGMQILSLENPLIVDADKSSEIRAGIFNDSNSSSTAEITIFDGDKEIQKRKVTLAAKKGLSLTALSDSEQSGIRTIRAVLKIDETSQEKISFISSRKREKVLLLSGSQDDSKLLDQAFENRAYELVSSNNKFQAESIKDFSAIILNNIANNQLPEGLISKLPEYVKAGGGLIVIGGNRAFGLGGYIGSFLADLLPVDMLPPKAQEKRLTLAVSLIIDKSRSMADERKLDFTKEAAKEVVRNLKDEDFIGVIGFDSSPFEVVRMGQLAQIRSQALERIGRLFPAQKTNLFPAMDEGRRRLQSVQSGRKHMIILTDGKIPDADQSYLELVKEMRINGITVSTVLVGSDNDFGFLRDLAQKGGGSFYQTADPSSIPRIFLQDVKVRSGEQSQQEKSSLKVKLGPSALSSTQIDSNYPDLLGYVETKPKDKAEHELILEHSIGTAPLLSSWQVGNGKVLAFTSDANGRWSRAWASWSKFLTFWTDILDSARGNSQKDQINYDLRVKIEGDQLSLDLTLFEENSAEIKASLSDAAANKTDLSFSKVKAGLYTSTHKLPRQSQTYTFSGKVGEKELTPISFRFDAENLKEKTGQGFNIGFLEEIASVSGGKSNPSSEDILASSSNKDSKRSLRQELLIISLFLYFICIVLREFVERPLTRVYNLIRGRRRQGST
jgi:Ca-activated chloride channel family protein